MKKKNMLQLLLLFLLGISLHACRKEDPPPPFVPTDYTKLPAATQIGANTFGCKVNGDVWVPRVELFVPESDKYALVDEKNKTGSGILITRLLTNNRSESFTLSFSSTQFQPKSFYTKSDPLYPDWFNPDYSTGIEDFQHTEGDSTNYLVVTAIDTINNFISGKFSCTLKNINGTQTVKITEGRFDMPYSQL